MAVNTLEAIRTKVRRLTRSVSPAQLSVADLDNYINTFVLYDLPEHLRMFNLRTQFTFTCNPYQAEYPTNEVGFGGNTTNALYNFQNRYLTIHPPVFIAGYQSFFSQSRQQFYGIYPIVNSIASIGVTGDGITTEFTGVINSQQAQIPGNLNQNVGLLPGQVLFSSVTDDFEGVAMMDVPVVDPVTGNQTAIGNLYAPDDLPATPPTVVDAGNFVNYVTGRFVVDFDDAPGNGQTINSQTVPQVVSLPQAMLYYDNKIVLRPMPDQPYRINFEAYVRPTELLVSSQKPELEEWWQYISYGAAKKVFEDRMDTDSVAQIMPEFKKQEALCLRRTLVQYSNERSATIYTEQVGGTNGGWGGSGSFGPF